MIYWNLLEANMDLEIRDHFLIGAKQQLSPNSSDRINERDISLLIIHNISLPPGVFGTRYVDQLFCNNLDPKIHPYFEKIAKLRVSAHLLISRAGDVTQYVAFNRKAWHAGDSIFKGRKNCNEFSIGIELEGTDHEAFTDMQYETLICVTKAIFKNYPLINQDRVQGHSDIAPGRKTDPGPYFEWQKYFDGLEEVLNSKSK
tara:strand:- start:92 stop:694 length:603 start_codon:yes stop_codon:yes gene_type:complete